MFPLSIWIENVCGKRKRFDCLDERQEDRGWIHIGSDMELSRLFRLLFFFELYIFFIYLPFSYFFSFVLHPRRTYLWKMLEILMGENLILRCQPVSFLFMVVICLVGFFYYFIFVFLNRFIEINKNAI